MYKVEVDIPSPIFKLHEGAIREAVLKATLSGMFLAERTSKKDYLSGPRPDKLGVVTGILRNSVRAKAYPDGNNIIGEIGSNVVYARAHEEGYKPRNLKARPFLSTAINDNIKKIEQLIHKAVDDTVAEV